MDRTHIHAYAAGLLLCLGLLGLTILIYERLYPPAPSSHRSAGRSPDSTTAAPLQAKGPGRAAPAGGRMRGDSNSPGHRNRNEGGGRTQSSMPCSRALLHAREVIRTANGEWRTRHEFSSPASILCFFPLRGVRRTPGTSSVVLESLSADSSLSMCYRALIGSPWKLELGLGSTPSAKGRIILAWTNILPSRLHTREITIITLATEHKRWSLGVFQSPCITLGSPHLTTRVEGVPSWLYRGTPGGGKKGRKRGPLFERMYSSAWKWPPLARMRTLTLRLAEGRFEVTATTGDGKKGRRRIELPPLTHRGSISGYDRRLWKFSLHVSKGGRLNLSSMAMETSALMTAPPSAPPLLPEPAPLRRLRRGRRR